MRTHRGVDSLDVWLALSRRCGERRRPHAVKRDPLARVHTSCARRLDNQPCEPVVRLHDPHGPHALELTNEVGQNRKPCPRVAKHGLGVAMTACSSHTCERDTATPGRATRSQHAAHHGQSIAWGKTAAQQARRKSSLPDLRARSPVSQ